MKITDVTITLFGWESIPSTIYGHHTARPTGKSDLGLLAVTLVGSAWYLFASRHAPALIAEPAEVEMVEMH